MNQLILKSQTPHGELLQATFLPEKGMNMISYKKGDLEVIDPSTRPLFEERSAGLGALIGPHFHRRRPETLPTIPDPSRFPHIARVQAKNGNIDPFSHGIGRYAPWKAELKGNKITAVLSGKDEWNGVPLANLEGQPFKMEFSAELNPDGLTLELSVVSEIDSIVGFHYYYALPTGQGKVISDVQNTYYEGTELKSIPSTWSYDSQQMLTYDLKNPADYAFHPFFDPLKGTILLDAETYRLQVSYQSMNQENAWQLYHPAGASFVCIEPLSAQNPHRPNLTVSSIKMKVTIL